MRCRECHASIPTPSDPRALTTKCQYCGLEQPVPDADERRKHLIAEQREVARLADIRQREQEHAWDKERDALERKAKRADRRSERRGRWFTVVIGLISALIAPVIIAITVFDAPARLGFGASGKERLEQIQTQLTSCTTIHPPEAEYASGPVSKLIGMAEGDCIRVFAAGGNGHSRLGVHLFGGTNTELAKQAETPDPQLLYCSKIAQTVRFQIDVGTASKGRLSHMVLKCPPPPPPRLKERPHSH